MADWRRALLSRVGAPVTRGNLRFLDAWQHQEGGHTKNDARFNWLNTTQDARGAVRSINSVGVKAFDTFDNGINAMADTLRNGYYTDILGALKSGHPFKANPSRGLQTWVAGPNGTNPRYAQAVLGSHAAVDTSPAVVSAVSPMPRAGTRKVRVKNARQQQMNAMFKIVFDDDPEFLQLLMTISDKTAQREGLTDPGGSVKPVRLPTTKEHNSIVRLVQSQLGKPYVFGSGPDTSSFDCSDLIQWAYGKMGIKIPRTTFDQIHVGRAVNPRGKLKPGDLVFPSNHHVVMYVGNGKVIAAPHTGTVVQYQDLSSFGDLLAVRRIL